MEEYHYVIELDLDTKPNGHMRVYARGVAPSLFNFERMKSFRIFRYKLEGHEYIRNELSRYFIKFQRQYKKRLLVRKKAFCFLRKRELGLAHPMELSRYLE